MYTPWTQTGRGLPKLRSPAVNVYVESRAAETDAGAKGSSELVPLRWTAEVRRY